MKWKSLCYIILSFAMFTLVMSCASKKNPSSVGEYNATLQVSSGNILNPNEADQPSPLYLTIYQLTSLGEFNNLDFFSLKNNPEQSLGEVFLSKQSFLILPNENKKIVVSVSESAKYLGFVAEYSFLKSGKWRVTEAADKSNKKFTINLNKYSMIVEE